jgi:hypothetical protein
MWDLNKLNSVANRRRVVIKSWGLGVEGEVMKGYKVSVRRN